MHPIIRSLPHAPGCILQGARWNYCILKHIKGDNKHTSTVYQAEVVPHEGAPRPLQAPRGFVVLHCPYSRQGHWLTLPPRALIKAAPPTDATAIENIHRECQTYHLPGVASAKCFRTLYDVIDERTIALEWLDTTLAKVKYQPTMHTYSLIMTVLEAVLTSCVALERHRCVNTG